MKNPTSRLNEKTEEKPMSVNTDPKEQQFSFEYGWKSSEVGRKNQGDVSLSTEYISTTGKTMGAYK